ncbi:hypothetical protein AAFF_G00124330 [Aldrovandia affinis]|uniref:Elongation factor 1-delta n=1 Tax=Aldrovandia affinis TaxID=143900 RepID=A0AAD7W9M5_9TELE|nr:hypothetical protein AAFF_G00124330 [Aldrovandia affinis]
MEAQRDPLCHAMDQPGLEHLCRPGQTDCATEVSAEGRAGGRSSEGNGAPPASSSSPEGSSMNGDRGGKRSKRRKHASHSGGLFDAGQGVALTGLRAESVWFERSVYEQAESTYQAWLTSSVGGAPEESPPATVQACRHGDEVACHHLVRAVWVNKSAFESAERLFMERARPLTCPSPATPASLAIPPSPSAPPDEGYLSLTPTPATPLPLTPPRQSINGLPGLPSELLTGVWVEKPHYDRAEAAYYQSLCGQLTPPPTTAMPSSSAHTHGGTEATHYQSVCGQLAPPTAMPFSGGFETPLGQWEQRINAQSLPSPAMEDPAEGAGQEGRRCFLHPDSERAWLEASRFHAAERLFRETEAATAVDAEVLDCIPPARLSEGDPPAPSMPCTDTMSGVEYLSQEKIWFDKFRYDEAERRFYEGMNGPTHLPQETGANTILQDIARARENIQKSLAGMKTSLQPGRGHSRTPHNRRGQPGVACGAGDQGELITRMTSLELENQTLHKVVEDLRSVLSKLESRVAVLEKSPVAPAPAPVCPNPKVSSPVEEDDDDDDDLDLFGSDEEGDEEAERIREQRVKEYSEKKAKKPALIAKSSILLDVKPWDDETDMVKLEECVRSVQADGLLWGSSKLLPVGYGIKKLQIACVVEDDKVGTDMLEEEITKFEDYVQSVDVAAFNKI